MFDPIAEDIKRSTKKRWAEYKMLTDALNAQTQPKKVGKLPVDEKVSALGNSSLFRPNIKHHS